MKPRDRDVRALLERLCAEVPAAATALGYGRGTCILHARVACDVLRERGVRARALTCRLLVANRPWLELANELGDFPMKQDWRGRGEWALGIGYGHDEKRPGYDGHVVTVVEERYLLDLTLDQANRPERAIEFEPVWFAVDRAFLTGERILAHHGPRGWARYEAIPEDRGFLLTPDWIMMPSGGRFNPLPLVRAALAA